MPPEETTTTDAQVTTDGQAQTATQEASEQAGQEPRTFDAAYVQRLRNEAAQHRKEATETKARLKEIEDASLSESERNKKEAAETKAENERLKRDLLRTKIAAKHGLPDVLADRLMGDDETAMEADAKVLAKLIVPPAASSGSPTNGATGRGERQLTAEDTKKLSPEQISEAYAKGLFNNALGRTG